jgi:hypothetical protein
MFSKHVKSQLSAYCNGELPEDESRRISEHLLACRKCRKEHEQINLGVRFAGELTTLSAPAEIWTGIEDLLDASRGAGEQRLVRKDAWTSRRHVQAIAVTAGLAIMIAAGALVYQRQTSKPAWAMEVVAGKPRVGWRLGRKEGKLYVGQSLETDESSRAILYPGPIGEVKVEPGSRVRVIGASQNEYRLSLERGEVQAKISAPPRLFFVDTPSAEAIDLGCAYTLDVDSTGGGSLHVTSGWVELALRGGFKSTIPVGAACLTRRGIGPGTPYFEDASPALKAALEQLDFGGSIQSAGQSPLDTILRESRKLDSLTLWHLLYRVAGAERGRVYDRLAELVPPPAGTTKDNLTQPMLEAWWLDVQRAWFD